jgi:hypothetical protein
LPSEQQLRAVSKLHVYNQQQQQLIRCNTTLWPQGLPLGTNRNRNRTGAVDWKHPLCIQLPQTYWIQHETLFTWQQTQLLLSSCWDCSGYAAAENRLYGRCYMEVLLLNTSHRYFVTSNPLNQWNERWAKTQPAVIAKLATLL